MTITHPLGIDIQVLLFDGTTNQDISADVRAMTIQSCKRSPLRQAWEPGVTTLQVDNSARKYDPLYTSGLFYGKLKPGMPLTVAFDSATSTLGLLDTQVNNQTDRFTIDFDKSNKDSLVTIRTVDALTNTAFGVIPAGSSTSGLTAGDKAYQRALDLSGLAGASFATPVGAIGAAVDFVGSTSGTLDTSSSTRLLDEYEKCADLEQGPMLSGRAAFQVEFYHRHWFKRRTNSATSRVTVGTGGIPFQDVSVAFDADEIITAVVMQDQSGNAVVAIDTAGEAVYGTKYPSVQFSNIPSLNDEDLEGAANTVLALRATEQFRIQSLTVKPGSHSSWRKWVIDLDLLDRITVVWTPTNTGSAISADYFIDGITHQITPGDWTTTYSLWPCAPFDAAVPGSLFIVDSSLVGGTDVVGL